MSDSVSKYYDDLEDKEWWENQKKKKKENWFIRWITYLFKK